MPTSWRSRLLLGLVVLAAAIGLVFAVRAMSSGPVPGEVASQSPTVSASPSEMTVAQPKPFRVKLKSVKGEEIDSSNMFGRKPDRRPDIMKRVAGKAAKALQRYLNATFVAPKTRFTRAGFQQLLTDNARLALDDRDRRALGAKGPTIQGGTTIAATARAVVVYEGNRPFAVTLQYAAKMRIIQRDKPGRLTQRGTIVLRRLGNGAWRADLADVRLSLPDPPPKGRNAAPSASEEPSEGGTS